MAQYSEGKLCKDMFFKIVHGAPISTLSMPLYALSLLVQGQAKSKWILYSQAWISLNEDIIDLFDSLFIS